MYNVLDKALPGNAKITQRTHPDDVAREMLAEKTLIDARAKLTWSPNYENYVPDDRRKGNINYNLPYIKIHDKYVIQNGKIWLTNGIDSITLAEIAESDPLVFPWVKQAFANYLKAAEIRDPRLCKECLAKGEVYRNTNNMRMALEHMNEKHPEIILSVVRGGDEKAEVLPKPGDPNPDGFVCCDKLYKDKRALGAHRRFSKNCPSR